MCESHRKNTETNHSSLSSIVSSHQDLFEFSICFSGLKWRWKMQIQFLAGVLVFLFWFDKTLTN